MISCFKRWIKLVKAKRKFKNVHFGAGVNIGRNAIFEGYNVLGKRVIFDGYCGRGSYIGENSTVYGKVGRFCSIGSCVTTLRGTHPLNFVSTNPSFYSTAGQNDLCLVKENKFTEQKYADAEFQYPVVIGNDVWIGHGALILCGVSVGDGAVIGAGAVVTKNVEPYTIVAGNPAKEIRKRFDENTVAQLIDLRWWDKDLEWLSGNADYFSDIKKFLKNFSDAGIT